MFVFMLLPLAALVYIGWHVWCLLPLTWIWKTVGVALLAGSFLLLFAGVTRRTDGMPMPLATAVYEVGTSSLMVMLYLFMLFLLLDLGRLLHVVPRQWLWQNGWTAGGIALLMVGLFVYGNLHYRHKYRQELRVESAKVSRPLRLVLLSDLHIGYHNRRSELHRWVDMINAERPDYVLIAGDIIDGSMRPLKEEQMHEEFRRLQAPVYACLGNHEYYSGEPEAQRFYQQAGIRLLQDESVVLDGGLCVIGRDDRTNQHRKSLGRIMKEASEKYDTITPHSSLRTPHSSLHTPHYSILLDHQPYHLEQAEQQRVDFQFSGHTHHGQVWPVSWITESIYECAFGEHRRGSTRYYVSSGMGIWGGKFRIGTRSEYVVLDIVPSLSSAI